ncbi:hypothetical protein ACF1E6_33030 [Streptomyces bacillaris]|uniref:hypothetical protein n=1 Tax=Streptomyces bacillaris TaxID=68179 RepID=UPI0036F94DC5
MTTTTTPTATPTTPALASQALSYEWIKFRSVRSTVWTTAATAVLPVLGAVFVAATGSLQPDDTVLGGSLTLSVVAQMLAAVVGRWWSRGSTAAARSVRRSPRSPAAARCSRPRRRWWRR